MEDDNNVPQIPAKRGGRENYKYYDVDGLGNMAERVSEELRCSMVDKSELTTRWTSMG